MHAADRGIAMTDLSTLLAELDAAVAKMPSGTWEVYSAHFIRAVNRLDSGEVIETSIGDARFREQAQGIVALVNAYPQLREALRSLMHEKATDSWYTGWQVAVRERDEARAERNARARDVMHLEALVEQQREALRGFVDAFQLDWSGHKLGDLIEKARAVLAAEVP